MKKISLIATYILLIVSCTTLKIEELNYGISQSKKLGVEKLENSPTGYRNIADLKLKIIEKTDSIKANIGTSFGVEYKIISPENKDQDILLTWEFPVGMLDSKGKPIKKLSYRISKPTNDYTYSNYTLENQNEVVKGKWSFIISSLNGKQLYKKDFYLY